MRRQKPVQETLPGIEAGQREHMTRKQEETVRAIQRALKTDGKVYREFKAALEKAQKGTP